ncbi:GAF domain-containing protein [Parasegetibacter sp. NRK P23]|uniref:GAF domain-containing protein n=1 Tax=Parasegetibacter sp. NRK P23 TaxID=2942999 RepID=UPI0020447184|nr:GAF domain-containing protein [Parasegetibacter sp. NRK P23]MCM5530458.1 histidine kinase [Parasegetibacter sp. NRK P23]
MHPLHTIPVQHLFRCILLNADEFLFVLPSFRRDWVLSLIILLAAVAVFWWIRSLREKILLEKTLNRFATSLYGRSSVEDIFWEIARNILLLPGFRDCVIYQYDPARKVLVQKAACGPKNPHKKEILNPIEIPLGKGIVGSVAETLKTERIQDTSKDERYIIDEQTRLAELAVPIIIDGALFGVIDTEHPEKGFYTLYHEKLLRNVADLCAVRISRFLIEEQLRAKIARDLHDEMGSTLTSINILCKVALQQMDDRPALNNHLHRIREYSAGLMESMSDIVWAINPANDTFCKLLIRMKELAAEMLEPMQIAYHFRNEGAMEEVKLNLEQRKNVYLVYKEALNNMVKYSRGNELVVSFESSDKSFRLRISDNGCSFDPSREYSGNGLRNMQVRAGELGGALIMDAVPEKGTSICLEVPFT